MKYQITVQEWESIIENIIPIIREQERAGIPHNFFVAMQNVAKKKKYTDDARIWMGGCVEGYIVASSNDNPIISLMKQIEEDLFHERKN